MTEFQIFMYTYNVEKPCNCRRIANLCDREYSSLSLNSICFDLLWLYNKSTRLQELEVVVLGL